MRRSLLWSLVSAGALACALPEAKVDPALDAPASGGTGGSAAGMGAGGSAGSGIGGMGGGDFSEEAREVACLDYCTTYLANCADSPPNTYEDENDCLNTCATAGWPFGPITLQENSLQCRQAHAKLAASAQDPHCFHSSEFPTKTICQLPPQ